MEQYKKLYEELSKGNSTLSFPFKYDSSVCDYLDYIRSLFKAYYEKIELIPEEEMQKLNHCLDGGQSCVSITKDFDLKNDIRSLSNLILDIVLLLFKGDVVTAYEELEKYFVKNEGHYFNLLPMIYFHNSLSFYRLRNKEGLEGNYGEMFHIPFEKRTCVQTQRFSIPGYPVLYLGDSFYGSWKEIGSPQLNNICFSRFENVGEVGFIDFTYPIDVLSLWEFYCFFLFYPLTMACLVQVRDPDKPFKPEYALPQLFLLLMKHHASSSIVGIRYLSSKSCSDKRFYNYVILTQNADQRRNYAKNVVDLFRMSEPTYLPDEIINEATAFTVSGFSQIEKWAEGRVCNDITLPTSGDSV